MSKIEAGHLSAIADHQATVSDHGMIPGFSLDGFETAEFSMFFGVGGDTDDFTKFTKNEKFVRFRQQQ